MFDAMLQQNWQKAVWVADLPYNAYRVVVKWQFQFENVISNLAV